MNPQNKTFEESMARLEQIVRAMEQGRRGSGGVLEALSGRH